MRAFDENIIEALNEHCGSDDVDFVGLGKYDFQLSFGYLRLQGFHKVGFSIGGKYDVWEEGPSEIPVWKLAGQIPVRFKQLDLLTLKLEFETGDYIEFHSDEGPYEAVLIEIAGKGDADFLEVY